MKEHHKGFCEIILSGCAFGFLGVFGKWAYRYGLSPGELLSLRFLVATFILALILFFKNKNFLILAKRDLISALTLGLLGYAVFSTCYFEALRGLSASLTVLLLYTYPVMVTLGALVFYGERVSLWGWIALPLTCAGLAMLVWGDVNVSHPISILFGIGSAVFYSAYILASRKWLAKVNPLSAVLYIQAAAGIALGLFFLRHVEHSIHLAIAAWMPLLGLAVISTVIPMVLFLSGLKKISSSEASILSTTEPLVGILAASFILGERLAMTQIAGGFLVILAMLLTALDRSSKSVRLGSKG